MASVPLSEQLARTPRHLCQKEKEQIRWSIAPDRTVGESQGEGGPHLGDRGEIRAVAWRRKGELQSEGRQVPRR